mgnify:CR=1 FL=1
MDNNLPINRHTIKKQEAHNYESNNKNEKTTDVFAAAFPSWDLMPPAVPVKRVRRGI